MHEIVREAETKGYLYPAEPLSRSRNVDALIRRATSTTRVAILLVGEGMNLAHHDLLDQRCPSGRAMKKVCLIAMPYFPLNLQHSPNPLPPQVLTAALKGSAYPLTDVIT